MKGKQPTSEGRMTATGFIHYNFYTNLAKGKQKTSKVQQTEQVGDKPK